MIEVSVSPKEIPEGVKAVLTVGRARTCSLERKVLCQKRPSHKKVGKSTQASIFLFIFTFIITGGFMVNTNT